MSSAEPNRSNTNNAATFENMPEDDGTLISPAAVGVGQASAEGDGFMSDDDGKVITTLEAPRASPTSAGEVRIDSLTIIEHGAAGSKDGGSESGSTQKTDDLLAKMKSRLSKQIDLKMVSPARSNQQQQHDASGSIEIPHDLILGNEIPATPLATDSAKELEDHDLIAILEGDDVEITESATEIEVRVGGSDGGVYNDDQVLEEIQISFVDEQDLELKEREKEIAMRQMANLPVLPKGRRPKNKPSEPATLRTQIFPLNIEPASKPSVKTETPTKPDSASFITIKGQTTIKPVPRPIMVPKKEPEDFGSPTPKKMVPISKSTPKIIPITQKIPIRSPIASPPPASKQTIPVSKQSPNELINSLVSDWDDEPIILKHEPVSPEKTTPKSLPAAPMAPPPTPPVEEPKRSRIIKKKIIWDPDNPETHMSFASFVKSNRTKPLPAPEAERVQPKESKDTTVIPFRPPGTGIRRKRAESVAVHMIKDPPYIPPPFFKRARTPEPISRKPQSITSNSKNSAVVRKKKSEIEKLLGDEGAINMLYDVECENSNKDLLKDADIKVDSDDEDEKLLAKAKIITDAVIKQGTSPNDTVTHIPRVRAKRASTPQQTSVSPLPTTTTITQSTSNPARKSGGTSNGPSRKRKQNSSASKDWDYVYNSQKTSDDAMIIRRRSNSSYSSSTSPRRLSVEQAATSQDNAREGADSPAFEFVKPTNKTKPANIKLDSSVVANMKGKLSKALGSKPKPEDPLIISVPSSSTSGTPPEKKAKISPKPKVVKSEAITITIDENGINSSQPSLQDKLRELKLKDLSCNQCGNYAEIVLAPKETHLKDVFTVELINELKTVLNLLKSESSVRAVLIKSSGKQFCRGIDVSYLIQTNAEKRKVAAQLLSGHLRNMLQSLATFNKPLVAAVHGDVLGIGVTILPLFEVVIASDNATFSTPYAMFGHLPEAMKIFSSSKNLKPKAITDLLYLNKKISASTALDYGIITEIVSSEKLQDKANSITKKLGSFSTQALKSIKTNLRQDLLTRLEDQLTSEQKKLTQQWISVECQDKFKQFVNRGGEW